MRRFAHRIASRAAIGLSIALAPLEASAQAFDAGDAARRAIEAYHQRDYEQSLALSRRLLGTSYPYQARVWWTVAHCLEHLNRPGEAIAAYRAYLNFEGESPARIAEARASITRLGEGLPGSVEVECDAPDVRFRFDRLEPQVCPASLPKVASGHHAIEVLAGQVSLYRQEIKVEPGTVHHVRLEAPARLTVAANVGRALVSVAGEPRGSVPLDALPLRPGAYRVNVEAAGYLPFSQVVDLQAGVARQLDVHLEREADLAPHPKAPGAGPWIVASGGAALLIAGVGFNLAQREAVSSDVDAANRYEALSITGYAVGGAAVAAGLAWYFWRE